MATTVNTFTYNGTTQYSKGILSDDKQDMGNVEITAKRQKPTLLVPNPLNDFASYSYALSLWWLDIPDYNTLAAQPDIEYALNWSPGPRSYVVAEDSGLYPDRRLPDSPGLNYNIQDVTFNSVITPTKTSRSSNVLDGSMTIIEPYGVTFIDQLVAASYDGTRFNNYTQQPYMLQVDFRGYDDNGEPIPQSAMTTFRKRFPIKILSMAVSVTNRGAEYKISFCSAGAVAHYPGTHTATPKIFTITAGTVGEFFIQLSNSYYDYHVKEVELGRAEYVEAVKFDIDPAISKSEIVDKLEIPLAKANTKAKGIDLSKSTFTIPANTPILDIITKVMSHSKFLYEKQLDPDTKKDTDPFSAFKTTTSVAYEGRDVANMVRTEGIVDAVSNRLPMTTTYKIHQYPVWSGTHPSMPQYPDSRKYSVKKYDYFYSGLNTEVIDFKLNFDTTYYTAVQAYTAAISLTETSQSTADDAAENNPKPANNKPQHKLVVNPAVTISGVQSVTPMATRNIVKNVGASMGMNLSSSPKAQIASDVMTSIYKTLNGDMLTIDMNILGDPTLIKQDDWLYCPSPSMVSSKYNQWDTTSQYEYASKYGSVRTDTGEVVVTVTINTPFDVDTEDANQGLMNPVPTYNKSLFSGQYTILMIANKFSNGQFLQTLQLARIINSDIAALFGGNVSGSTARDSVSTSQNSQTNLISENQQAQNRAQLKAEEVKAGLDPRQ